MILGTFLILGGISMIGTAIGVALGRAMKFKRSDFTEKWYKSQVWDP